MDPRCDGPPDQLPDWLLAAVCVAEMLADCESEAHTTLRAIRRDPSDVLKFLRAAGLKVER